VDGISIHSLPGSHPSAPRPIWNDDFWNADSLDLDPSGRYVGAPTEGSGVFVIPLDGGEPRQLKGSSRFQQYRSVTFSNQGSVAAINEDNWIEIWNPIQNTPQALKQVQSATMIKYSPDGTLFLGDNEGSLRKWNSQTGSFSVLGQSENHGGVISIAFSDDSRTAATTAWSKNNSELRLYDLQTGKSSLITSHGNRVTCVALDHSGTKLVTGDADGIVRVGPITGETPMMLLGHQQRIRDVAVSPDGKWIVSAETGPTVRLWRMPEGKPIQALPTTAFLNATRKLTNVRVVADETLPTGYRAITEPNTSWANGAGEK